MADMAATNDAELKTAAETAAYFGVHRRTVHDWCGDPSFPGRPGKPGMRNGHFPVAEIRQWLAARKARRK